MPILIFGSIRHSVAILGDISPIGLHLNVAGSKKKFFATFHIRYILGYISVQKKICQKYQKNWWKHDLQSQLSFNKPSRYTFMISTNHSSAMLWSSSLAWLIPAESSVLKLNLNFGDKHFFWLSLNGKSRFSKL